MLVKCAHCGQIYDIGKVKTVARYTDCTVFIAPCCNRQVDDRSWKSQPDFEKIDAEEILRRRYWEEAARRFASECQHKHIKDGRCWDCGRRVFQDEETQPR